MQHFYWYKYNLRNFIRNKYFIRKKIGLSNRYYLKFKLECMYTQNVQRITWLLFFNPNRVN